MDGLPMGWRNKGHGQKLLPAENKMSIRPLDFRPQNVVVFPKVGM